MWYGGNGLDILEGSQSPSLALLIDKEGTAGLTIGVDFSGMFSVSGRSWMTLVIETSQDELKQEEKCNHKSRNFVT